MIFLQPIGQVNDDILNFLKHSLSFLWPTEILPQVDIPKDTYNKNRGQHEGSALLDTLQVKGDAVLGVTEVDTYVEDLNFIFGLALGRKALISLKRLKPDLYGSPDDEELLKLRALNEAVHELGHVFGLTHCPNRRCVMHFSNSIWDTDIKDWRYCRSCLGGKPIDIVRSDK
ncbi:MAG: archaemetzincin family Zn-dependent metalloprotease [Methanotrichaceae archaeon]|nr:archaemetzincin family Zn-dependent metalloprotease [Methanotrichaceae archaeon]